MLRPNYAMDPPPTSIEVGGFSYSVNVDYRVWLDVLRLMREVTFKPRNADAARRSAEALADIQVLVFGGVLEDEHPALVARAVSGFLAGYPTAPARGGGGGSDRPYSFEYDLSEIIVAIRNQSGIDLSYRRTEPFHWWEFLLEVRTLCGDHYILRLAEARTYKGKDRELLRHKYAVALPDEYTAEEQAELDIFNASFATGWEEDTDED